MSILAKPTISPLKICRFENETLKVSLSYDLAFNSKKLTVGKIYSWTTRDGNFSKRDGLGRDGCATISFSLFSLVHAMRVSSLRHRLRVRGAP